MPEPWFRLQMPTKMERETGIEPATNGLGSRDSTTELLPLSVVDLKKV